METASGGVDDLEPIERPSGRGPRLRRRPNLADLFEGNPVAKQSTADEQDRLAIRSACARVVIHGPGYQGQESHKNQPHGQ